MRRLTTARPAVALALAAALALAGCGGGGADDMTGTDAVATEPAPVEAGTEGPFPTAAGEPGAEPVLTFPPEDPSASLQASVLSPGDGRRVEAGDLLVLHYLGQVWGGEVFDGSYERGTPMTVPIGVGAVVAGWDAGLVGQDVGSRVLLTIPPDLGYGPAGNADAGISGTDTMVFVVDILGGYGPDAAGAADATRTPEAADVEVDIEGEPGSPATVRVPDGASEPTAPSVTVLAEASGAPVRAGPVVVHYAATHWTNAATDSTWERGQAATFTLGSGGPFDGLIGVPVGSRALVLIPASGQTPAIAAVVDVLGQHLDTP